MQYEVAESVLMKKVKFKWQYVIVWRKYQVAEWCNVLNCTALH